MSLALETFAEAMKPADQRGIRQWVEEEVVVPHSIKSPNIDYSLTPFHVDPLECLEDEDTRELVLMAPTGSGKTTAIIEAASTWLIGERQANSAIVFHTEKAINKWRASRGEPTWKASKKTANLLPPERSPKNKREYIRFPNMMLQTIFASPSQLQGDTIKVMIGDEIWEWKPDMLEELRRRNHGQYDYKLFMTSQGGFDGDQLDRAFKQGEIFDWCYQCPECEQYHSFKWAQVKGWIEKDENGDKKAVKNDADEWDWDLIQKNARYECETKDCKKIWYDKPMDRRSMNDNARYISRQNNHLPGRKSYHFNAMAVWWVPFFDAIQAWIIAQDALKVGNKKPLQQFIQKRLAESWEEILESTELNRGEDDYLESEYNDGQKWEYEVERFMTIDVQGDHFMCIVRLHSLEHGSRKVYSDRVETWEGLRILQRRYGLRNNQVFVDRNYRPDEVAEECYKAITKDDNQPWWCLAGDRSQGYLVKNSRTRRTERKAVSNFIRYRTSSGLHTRYVKFSNLLNKDVLTGRMKAGLMGVGADFGEEYKKQVENEHKVRKKDGTYIYEIIKEWIGNHYFDCEVMQVVAMTIYKLIHTSTDAEND